MSWRPTDLASLLTEPTPLQRVVLEDRAILVALWHGTWHAFEDRCSHAGCSFSEDGEVIGARAICNCHGSEFDIRTGQVLRPPARDSLATYPVRTVGGRIEIDL